MAEPIFTPQAGQIDYTNARYCPVINCVARFKGKILLVHRAKNLRLYPGYWNGVSGFLDDKKSVEDKAREELIEEVGLKLKQIKSIKRGPVLVQESKIYKKTWIVFTVLVEVSTDKINLDWEAKTHRWVTPADAQKLKLLPGFTQVLLALKLL